MAQMQAFFFNPPFEENYWANILKEIYIDKIYRPYIEGKNLDICLEIGGNVGLVSYYFSKYFKKVYVLEPAKEHFEVLTHMLNYNKITNVLPYQIALDNKNGEADFFHQFNNKTMHSLISLDPNNKDKEIVRTIRLDDFMKNEKIEHIDVMKLDCEGIEANIICGDAFANVASKIDIIIGESHSWMGRNINQFIDGFKNNGFSFEPIKGEAELFVAKRIK